MSHSPFIQKLESLSLSELKEQRIYNELNENAKKAAGEHKDEIIQFIKEKILLFNYEPYEKQLQSQVLTFFDPPTRFTMEHYNNTLKINALYAKSTPDSCVFTGKNNQSGGSLLVTTQFVLTWANRKNFGLCDFIPVILRTDYKNWFSYSIFRIYTAFLYSRLKYFETGKEIPIVINGAMTGKCPHAICILFMPNVVEDDNEKSSKTYWNRIYVDTSAVSLNEKKIECKEQYTMIVRCLDAAWEKYQLTTKYYKHPSTIFYSSCVKNIQQKFGTCSNWSF